MVLCFGFLVLAGARNSVTGNCVTVTVTEHNVSCHVSISKKRGRTPQTSNNSSHLLKITISHFSSSSFSFVVLTIMTTPSPRCMTNGLQRHCSLLYSRKGSYQAKKIFSYQSKTEHETPKILTAGFQPTDFTAQGVYMGSTFLEYPPRPLPQLDASALLDPKSYCRKSVFTSGTPSISGGEAARRLLNGRNLLLEIMRRELHSNNNSNNRGDGDRKIYVLRGHGVPTQLLQYHLDVANQWLQQHSSGGGLIRQRYHQLKVENRLGSFYVDR
jgi:hypothetical protein